MSKTTNFLLKILFFFIAELNTIRMDTEVAVLIEVPAKADFLLR